MVKYSHDRAENQLLFLDSLKNQHFPTDILPTDQLARLSGHTPNNGLKNYFTLK